MTQKPLRLLKSKRPVSVTMDGLFKTVKSIIDHGKEKEFLDHCRQNNLAISAPVEVINAVKRHFVETGAHLVDSHAAKVAQSPPPSPGEPPDCFR